LRRAMLPERRAGVTLGDMQARWDTCASGSFRLSCRALHKIK
jgi:hypothetical protein